VQYRQHVAEEVKRLHLAVEEPVAPAVFPASCSQAVLQPVGVQMPLVVEQRLLGDVAERQAARIALGRVDDRCDSSNANCSPEFGEPRGPPCSWPNVHRAVGRINAVGGCQPGYFLPSGPTTK
jgi:hypothetical protein